MDLRRTPHALPGALRRDQRRDDSPAPAGHARAGARGAAPFPASIVPSSTSSTPDQAAARPVPAGGGHLPPEGSRA